MTVSHWLTREVERVLNQGIGILLVLFALVMLIGCQPKARGLFFSL